MKTFDYQYFTSTNEMTEALGYDPRDDVKDYTEEFTGKVVSVSFFSAYTNPDGLVLDESIGYLISYDWDRDWGGSNFYVNGPVRRSVKEVVVSEPYYERVKE